jgi:hypothetical protein
MLGRLEEKHAFTAADVAEVMSELKQEFAPLRLNQGGES